MFRRFQAEMKDNVHSFMQIKCVHIQSSLGVVDGIGGFHLEGDGHSSVWGAKKAGMGCM